MSYVKTETANNPNWAIKATETIDKVVNGVGDKSVRPLTSLAKLLVFGILAAIIGSIAMILFVITFVRILDTYLFSQQVWITDLIVGGIFTIAGLLIWTKRHPKPKGNH